MLDIYLESSAINWIVDSSLTHAAVSNTLSKSDFRPVVGAHVIYELARIFLTKENTAKGKRLFTLIRDLDPSYSPGSSNLITQEIKKLRTGAAVLPSLGHVNQMSRTEVGKLASGLLDNIGRSFIEQKETERKSYTESMDNYIKNALELKAKDPNSVPHFRVFEDMVAFFHSKIPSMICDIFHHSIGVDEAKSIAENIDQFPAIRSAVRSNLYLMWICIRKKAIPRLDKLDDYKHIVEASYCDAIISRDSQLLRTVPLINPNLRALPFLNIFNDLLKDDCG